MCTSIRYIRLLPLLLLLLSAQACKRSSSSAVNISGQVLDGSTGKPIPGIRVRLLAVFSPAKDTLINTSLTDQNGKYTITTSRGIINRFTDTATAGYRKALLTLAAEPAQAEQPRQYKNPYVFDKKGLPYIFFNRISLPQDALDQSNIAQDIKMHAGAMIICRSPRANANRNISLDVTALQPPRDHFRVIINGRRYLVLKPGHPYLLSIISEPPGTDTTTPAQIIRQDTIRLNALDTLPVNL